MTRALVKARPSPSVSPDAVLTRAQYKRERLGRVYGYAETSAPINPTVRCSGTIEMFLDGFFVFGNNGLRFVPNSDD